MTDKDSLNSFDPRRIKQETPRRLIRTGAISAGVAGLTFLAVLWLFRLTALLPTVLGSGAAARRVDWGLLEGVASVITLSLVTGGLAFAFVEYIQDATQRAREHAVASFGIYKEVFDRLMNPQDTAARRWIIQTLPSLEQMNGDQDVWLSRVNALLDERPAGWEGERSPGGEHLKQVLNTFDFLGFVARHYWNMENELVEWMSPSIAKVWERVSLCVEDEARRRNEKDFYESAREFGNQCVEWRQKRYPASNIIEDAT